MDVEVLNHFLTVVREENISRAAELLHLTQPTLSRQMAALEEELGTQLFIRGKHLQLTDAGVLLRGRAEEVTQIIDKIRMEFKAGEELSGVVSIGTGGLMSAQILSKLISEFRALHPAVRFNIYTNSADHLREQLDRGLLDFAFLLEPVDIGKYDYVRMQVKERWGILMPKGHPLEEKPLISRKDLLHQPLVMTNRANVQKKLAGWFGGSMEHLDIIATYNLINNVANLVSDGTACAMTLEGAVNFLDPQKFTFRPLSPDLSATSVVAWKKLSPFFGAASAFLSTIKRYAKTE